MLHKHQYNDKVKFYAKTNATPRQSSASTTLQLGLKLRALLLELASFLFQSSAQRGFFRQLLFSSEFSNVFRYSHAAEMRTAHGTEVRGLRAFGGDRKSTRLNSSHSQISYAVFCL